VVFFVLCVAILNLGLGYGLALCLHSHAGELPWGQGKAFSFGRKVFSLIKEREEKLDEPAPAAHNGENAETSATAERVANTSSQLEPKPSTSPVGDPPQPQAAPPAEQSGDEQPTFETAKAFEALASAAARSSGGEPRGLETSAEVDEDAIAGAIEGLRAELKCYRGEIAAVDARLHDCAMAPDEPTVRSCATQLREANHQYLEQQETHRERLSTDSARGDAAAAVRELAHAAERQAGAITASQAELAKLDQETDLLVQCQQMLDETRQISETSDELQAAIGVTLAVIAPEAVELPPMSSAATDGGRRALVAQIDAWRETSAESNSRFSVAMIDPDQLGQLNEQHSRTVVDRALKVLDRIVQDGLRPGQIAARPKGQSRLLFLPNVTPREAVNVVERCRQQIDATRFQFDEKRLQLTVSCAVAQTDRAEATPALAARLEAMLNEAKRYGRNRTFYQEGDYPAPAVPPALAIEGQVVSL
jgi:diguanylate cyclase (GGDEF)-like protein